jgi:hypothetical protein
MSMTLCRQLNATNQNQQPYTSKHNKHYTIMKNLSNINMTMNYYQLSEY